MNSHKLNLVSSRNYMKPIIIIIIINSSINFQMEEILLLLILFGFIICPVMKLILMLDQKWKKSIKLSMSIQMAASAINSLVGFGTPLNKYTVYPSHNKPTK